MGMYEKKDMEDGEEIKRKDIKEEEDVEGGRNEEEGGKNNKKEGIVEKKGDQRNEKDRKIEEYENRVEIKVEKEVGVYGRDRKVDLGIEKKRNEKDEGGGVLFDLLNRFFVEGVIFIIEKGGDNKIDLKKKVKVCFYVFIVLIVNFDQRKDEFYVIFGFERNNWDCNVEGFMEFSG